MHVVLCLVSSFKGPLPFQMFLGFLGFVGVFLGFLGALGPLGGSRVVAAWIFGSFWNLIFQSPFFTPQKNYVTSGQDGSWGQLVRFRTPTWHPKTTQNPHFSCFKTNLILRCAKTQNLVIVLRMDHIFATPGVPEIHQKSMNNRS